MSSLAKVEEAPLTAAGAAFGFSEKPPSSRTELAARESEAMGPGPSWTGGAGSDVTCEREGVG